jgi:hypothetical protein
MPSFITYIITQIELNSLLNPELSAIIFLIQVESRISIFLIPMKYFIINVSNDRYLFLIIGYFLLIVPFRFLRDLKIYLTLIYILIFIRVKLDNQIIVNLIFLFSDLCLMFHFIFKVIISSNFNVILQLMLCFPSWYFQFTHINLIFLTYTNHLINWFKFNGELTLIPSHLSLPLIQYFIILIRLSPLIVRISHIRFSN